MAYTTINKSSSFMNNKLYTGNGSAGNAITGVGFQSAFTWIKDRDNTRNHVLTDAVRGVTKVLNSNTKDAEVTDTSTLTAFGTDGFTLGNGTKVNGNNINFASWNWKAGTAVSGNTTGSGTYKTYTGSVNTTAGFSIIKYTGNGSAGHTIPHHLGAVPKLFIVRQLGGDDWKVYSSGLPDASKSIKLDESGSYDNDAIAWNSTAPTSSVFTLGTASATNKVNEAYISYCFADVTGYSKFGSYTGNNNADGTFVYTGFKPAFVMFKCSTNAANWGIYDNERVGYNEVKNVLFPDLSNAENTDLAPIDLLSNGFKMRRNDSASDINNKGGATYIYMAFGQSIVGTNNIPNNAR